MRFANIFPVSDYVWLEQATLLLSAANKTTSEGCNVLAACKQGSYEVTPINQNTRRILEDGSKNIIYIH